MSHTHILSVLIADDEKPIREELGLFDWESCNAVIVGEASNGQEALKMCGEYQPDLLIADITMPLIDGISLMTIMKEKYPRTQVVLLTCHSNFEYARKALQMGAVSYIVKVTMTDEDIRSAVRKATENIGRQMMLDSYSREADRLKLSETFSHILSRPGLPDTPGQRGLPVRTPVRFIRLCLGFYSRDWIFVDRQIRDFLDSRAATWFLLKTGEYILLLEPDDPAPTSAKVGDIVRELEKSFETDLSYIRSEIRIYALIGDVIHSAAEFSRSYFSLEGWKCRHFYEPDARKFSGDPGTVRKLTPDVQKILEKSLREVRKDDGSIARFISRTFRQWAMDNQFFPEELKSYSIGLVTHIADMYSLELPLQAIAQKIFACDSVDQLISVMTYLLDKSSGNVPSCGTQIRLAQKTIQNRLSEPISLKSIADEVGLSPNYFSRIFSEQTGEPFNEYVTRQRMEKAIDLLKNSGLKVYEIAEGVGIPSYRYFSSLFKNWTGKTPKEYQKRC